MQDQLQSEFVHERFELINRFRFDVQADNVTFGNENLRFFIPKCLDCVGLFHFVCLLDRRDARQREFRMLIM